MDLRCTRATTPDQKLQIPQTTKKSKESKTTSPSITTKRAPAAGKKIFTLNHPHQKPRLDQSENDRKLANWTETHPYSNPGSERRDKKITWSRLSDVGTSHKSTTPHFKKSHEGTEIYLDPKSDRKFPSHSGHPKSPRNLKSKSSTPNYTHQIPNPIKSNKDGKIVNWT